MDTAAKANFHWSCKHTWKQSAKNTAWCLLGCSIGDFGTILFFQLTKIPIAQPSKHHVVFFALLVQVCLQAQSNVEEFIII